MPPLLHGQHVHGRDNRRRETVEGVLGTVGLNRVDLVGVRLILDVDPE